MPSSADQLIKWDDRKSREESLLYLLIASIVRGLDAAKQMAFSLVWRDFLKSGPDWIKKSCSKHKNQSKSLSRKQGSLSVGKGRVRQRAGRQYSRPTLVWQQVWGRITYQVGHLTLHQCFLQRKTSSDSSLKWPVRLCDLDSSLQSTDLTLTSNPPHNL